MLITKTTKNTTRGRAEEEGDVNDDAFKEMMASYLNNFERKFVPEKINKERYDAYVPLVEEVVYRLRKIDEANGDATSWTEVGGTRGWETCPCFRRSGA